MSGWIDFTDILKGIRDNTQRKLSARRINPIHQLSFTKNMLIEKITIQRT